jgi:invasion protein IalB
MLRNRTTMTIRIATLVAIFAFAAAGSAYAQDSSTQPTRAEMVQRWEAACGGKAEGAQCSFTRRNGKPGNGTCVNKLVRQQNVLLCMTPAMQKRMSGQSSGGSENQ